MFETHQGRLGIVVLKEWNQRYLSILLAWHTVLAFTFSGALDE